MKTRTHPKPSSAPIRVLTLFGGSSAGFARVATGWIAASLLAVTAGLGGCGKGVSESTIEFAGLDEVRELQAANTESPRTLLLIDPRAPRRYATGHIPGAVSVQLPEIREFGGKDARLTGYEHTIVYGENPASPTARAMTKRLLMAGYSGVRLFPGGLDEWMSADLPVEESPMPEGETTNAPD